MCTTNIYYGQEKPTEWENAPQAILSSARLDAWILTLKKTTVTTHSLISASRNNASP